METIENTIVKINVKPVKDLIKTYVDNQKIYKDQRKAAHNKLKRIIEPKDAQYKAFWNGVELRILYAAYGLLRGKKLSQIEQNYLEEDKDNFLNQHKMKIVKTLEGFKSMSKIKL